MAGLAKGLAIMELFNADTPRLTVNEAAAATGIAPAVARRCLRTFEELGHVTYDGKFYRPTPRLMRLAFAYAETDPLPQLAAPRLAALRDAFNEASSLAVLDGDDAVFVARQQSTHLIATGFRVGTRLPLHASAAGRVLLSALPDDEIEERLSRVVPQRMTSHSLTTRAAIRERVHRARVEGYDVQDQEIELGLVVVAVPVVDPAGATVASISVSALNTRMPLEEMMDRVLPMLRDEAERLGRVL